MILGEVAAKLFVDLVEDGFVDVDFIRCVFAQKFVVDLNGQYFDFLLVIELGVEGSFRNHGAHCAICTWGGAREVCAPGVRTAYVCKTRFG